MAAPDPDSPHASLGRERYWFLLGLLAFCGAIAARELGDFDLPWHIALGRAVWELRAIPKLDPLAFTHQRITFIEPLSELPLYGLWKAGGALPLQIFGALLSAGVGWLLFQQLRRQGAIAYLATGLALAGMNSWMVVRPATLSFLLIALTLALIEWHRRTDSPRTRRFIVCSWPPLALLWANAHGFVFIGVGLLATYSMYRLACRLARGRLGALLPERDAVDTNSALLATLVAALAGFANAAGPTLHLGPSRIFSSDPEAHYGLYRVTESALPGVGFFVHHEPLGPLIALFAVLGLWLGKRADGERAWPSLFEVALVLLGMLGFVWMVRSVPLGVLLMTPVLARRWSAFLPRTALTSWALATSSWLAAGFALLNPSMNLGVGFDATHFPERAVSFIRQHQLRGHLFNFSPFGGYLSLELYPDRLIFMDGRLGHARDGNLVVRADDALQDPRVFADLEREFDFQYAVISAREGEGGGVPLARANDWTMVHLDDVAAVYVRSPGPNAALAASGYRVLRHLTELGSVLQLASAGDGSAPLLLHDARLAVAQDPYSPRAAFLLACGELAVRNEPGFAVALRRLAALAPGHPALGVLAARFRQLQTSAPSAP
ncbi:MAG: hypothetical protein ABW061_03600 [Polyangiaceae bacterium]